jgi:hypothetical protein
MLNLPVSRTLRATDCQQPETRVTSQKQAERLVTGCPTFGPCACPAVHFGDTVSAPSEVDALRQQRRQPPEPIHIQNRRPKDWIDHASFGAGEVSESQGDKLDINFVHRGRKTLLTSTELNRAIAPGEGSKIPRDKSKPRTSQLKVKSPSETITG